MTLKSTLATAIAAFILTATAGAALAAPGVATGTVNIREDAGTDYDIIGHLAKGEFTNIIGCEDGWCEIIDHGEHGYVSASYLALVDFDDDDDDDDDHHHHHHHHSDADVDLEVSYGGFELDIDI